VDDQLKKSSASGDKVRVALTRAMPARRAVARRLVTAALNNLFFIGVLAASVTKLILLNNHRLSFNC
jgi:hypothetical protein